ncbi:MAG: hypothetical protein ING84_06745 [Cytophagales bacterium]|nr:hypothetical protein [Cytophagales bacterium]MCA6365599.1 hypothetical protein [Cytophagales bacterium]MCA6372542.1 hypothetical protein [Cytophagales bacterium]MCA6374318.1 hypothetical protein [Cytophagales bacterium]MCA6383179.1 hypothetical protein [Cytophagales bacterium]
MNKQGQHKVIWFLWANPKATASSRIQGLAIHSKLKELGYNSCIAYVPTSFERTIPLSISEQKNFKKLVNSGDLVILQKCKDDSNLPTIAFMKEIGLNIVLVDCDLPLALTVGKAVDRVICSSQRLCDNYLNHGIQSHYIEDAPEWYVKRTATIEKSRLKCFWFGDGSHQRWSNVEKLKNILKDPRLSRWELVTISNHTDATIRWRPDYLKTLSEHADAIALPIFTDEEASSYKSANRLLQSMALSLPTICSPILAYQNIAAQAKGMIVCKTNEEWVNAFITLQNTATRHRLATEAFESAQKYNLDYRIQEWIDVLTLDENFKTDQRNQKLEKQISNFFYIQLIRYNIRYFFRVPFSLQSIKSALHYFFITKLGGFTKNLR